jgi:hypothetical protein
VSYPLIEAGKQLDVTSPVKLTIASEATRYTLSITVGDVSATASFSSETLTIFPPVGGAFCGTMFGLYAFGPSEPVLTPSDFHNIYIDEGKSK